MVKCRGALDKFGRPCIHTFTAWFLRDSVYLHHEPGMALEWVPHKICGALRGVRCPDALDSSVCDRTRRVVVCLGTSFTASPRYPTCVLDSVHTRNDLPICPCHAATVIRFAFHRNRIDPLDA